MPLSADDIHAELARLRLSIRAVGRRLGMPHSTVVRAITGEVRTPQALLALQYIACLLGVRVEELAPGPRSPRPTSEDTSKSQPPAMSSCSLASPRQAAGGGR